MLTNLPNMPEWQLTATPDASTYLSRSSRVGFVLSMTNRCSVPRHDSRNFCSRCRVFSRSRLMRTWVEKNRSLKKEDLPDPCIPTNTTPSIGHLDFATASVLWQCTKPRPAHSHRTGLHCSISEKRSPGSLRQNQPPSRQHVLNRLPDPQGQRSFRPSFSSSSLSP